MSVFPLTTVQQAVWLDQLLMPEMPYYNTGALWHIDKPLDIALFHQAIRQVMRQHDALNIVLNENENGINQTTVYNKEPFLESHDLSKESLSLAQVKSFLHQKFIRPFKLYGELLWRSSTVKISDSKTLWMFNAHHLIIDGTSVSLLSKAIIDCYKSLQAKELTAIIPQPGYREFITSDGDYLRSNRYQRDREYWLQYFTEAPASPLTRRQGFAENKAWPSTQSTRRLPAEHYQRLADFSRRVESSEMHFFSALLACWYARQWQTDTVTLGVPVHNRSGARYKQMPGMFSSMMPIKLTIDGTRPFAVVVKQIADELRRSRRHQRFPIAELNRHLRLNQQGRRQLFDLSFSLDVFPFGPDLDGVPLKVEPLHHYYEQLPLAVWLRHDHPGDDPLLECNVNQAWFRPEEAEQIADGLLQMIAAVLDGPADLPVARLPLRHAVPSADGRPDRKTLLPPAGPQKKACLPPANDEERLLAEYWRELLSVAQVSRDDNFFALGGHSVHVVQLLRKLKHHGVTTAMKTLFTHPTLREQADAIRSGCRFRAAAAPNLLRQQLSPQQKTFRLLQPLNAHTAKRDLWMVHPAIVGCEIYQDLALRLAGSMNVIGINNYNLCNQPHISALPALASYYLQHMQRRGLSKDRPVRLLGWSTGGLIALEMAAQLEQAGYQDIHIVVLDSLYQTSVQQLIVPEMLAPLLTALGLEGEAGRRAQETELRLNNQPLSAALSHSKVTLFKATKYDGLAAAENNRVLAIADNGLGKICPRLTVIPLAADHHSIIHCHQDIIAALTDTLALEAPAA